MVCVWVAVTTPASPSWNGLATVRLSSEVTSYAHSSESTARTKVSPHHTTATHSAEVVHLQKTVIVFGCEQASCRCWPPDATTKTCPSPLTA